MFWTLASAPPPQQFPGASPEFLGFFAEIGLMGQAVFLVLFLFSLASWAVMAGKYFQLAKAARHTRSFLDIFRRSKRFSEVNEAAGKHVASPLVGLFQAGYVEVDAQVKSQRDDERGSSSGHQRYRIKSLDGVERSLRRALAVELALLQKGTNLLATTAGASPFIGLFGTVWGIMGAFRDIGLTGSTSIVAVAPGIAEALINTAAGLAAAIPALIGYNYFGHRLRMIRAEMEDFVLEFLNLTERNFT